jgi:dihydrofolate reductase
MRKIVMFNLISLDGFFAGEDGNIDWHMVDDEFNDFAVEQTASFGGIIFGRTTYQLFESFWPQAKDDPSMSPEDRKIGQIIDDVEKHVFSKSLKKVSWNHSILHHEINTEEMKKLKKQQGKDIVIFGSGTIVQQLAKLGLIDEYRILVNPIVLGKGKPLFKDNHLKLQLVATKVFGNGNVLLTYKPH